MDWIESPEAIGEIDELLASVGLGHGRRQTLAGTWQGGERRAKKASGSARAARKVGAAGRVVRAEGWERYAWLRHGFSTRLAGVSEVYGPGELNLGWTASDDPGLVAENRRRLVAEVAGSRDAAARGW